MKKILLSLMLICAFAIVKAQVCGTGPIYHWTGLGDAGDQGNSPAPLTIDGNPTDWFTAITGIFAYANSGTGGFEGTPHSTPVAAANVQIDGLRGATTASGFYDMDRPGGDHRDLRYFAFTYDLKNIYFYFRRPQNNTAQVTLYYFVDINVDGYMKTGEPVIKVTFNNSSSSIEMGFYTAVNSNGTIPGSYDATKGNRMTAPSDRPGDFANDGITPAGNSAGSTQWAVGAADGWNMPGDYTPLKNGVHPSATTGGEVFNAATITDTHITVNGPVTVPGYAVEFAVPWSYLGLYTANNGLQAGSSLTAGNVFTWHVALQGGNSGVSSADDNAGGCCQGLAVSGAPNVTVSNLFGATPGGVPPYDYRLSLSFHENRNLNNKVTVSRITINNPKDANGADIPAEAIQSYTLTGYIDADCLPATAGTSAVTFTYNSVASDLAAKKYAFTPSNQTMAILSLAASGDACYYVDIHAFAWPPLKSANISYNNSLEFDINSVVCNPLESSNTSGNLDVLPVKMTYFNAARSGQNVNLSWQTSFEENNTGFEIQRFTGVGGWQTIGFVATQATYGNSGIALNYQYTDINTTKGITQYRLKQVDKGNRSAYSVIRSVRGLGQKANTIIYPNPSGDGKVSVVFDDASGIHDVSLMDVSGKTLKQWKGVTNNTIQIDNLSSGFYTVRIVNAETGEQVVEKFIVNKR